MVVIAVRRVLKKRRCKTCVCRGCVMMPPRGCMNTGVCVCASVYACVCVLPHAHVCVCVCSCTCYIVRTRLQKEDILAAAQNFNVLFEASG